MPMVRVTVEEGEAKHVFMLSDEAMALTRYTFNPSGNPDVTRMKALSTALITQMMSQLGHTPHAQYELETAIAFAQTAGMWGVLGATKPSK